MRFLLPLILVATPALADDVGQIEACLAETGVEAHLSRTCIGLISTPCIEAPGGSTTVGMMDCLGREHDAWDVLLNRYWGPMMAKAREVDAAEAGSGAPSSAEALRTAQRAWIAFRDADCAHAASEWGSGTMAGPIRIGCLLERTAERTISFHLSLQQ